MRINTTNLCYTVHRNVKGKPKPIQPHTSKANCYQPEQEDMPGQDRKQLISVG